MDHYCAFQKHISCGVFLKAPVRKVLCSLIPALLNKTLRCSGYLASQWGRWLSYWWMQGIKKETTAA